MIHNNTFGTNSFASLYRMVFCRTRLVLLMPFLSLIISNTQTYGQENANRMNANDSSSFVASIFYNVDKRAGVTINFYYLLKIDSRLNIDCAQIDSLSITNSISSKAAECDFIIPYKQGNRLDLSEISRLDVSKELKPALVYAINDKSNSIACGCYFAQKDELYFITHYFKPGRYLFTFSSLNSTTPKAVAWADSSGTYFVNDTLIVKEVNLVGGKIYAFEKTERAYISNRTDADKLTYVVDLKETGKMMKTTTGLLAFATVCALLIVAGIVYAIIALYPS